MNYLDIIILIPLLWGTWKGFKRGLVFEVAMLIGLLLGFYIAFKFSDLLEGLVGRYITGSGIFLPYLTFLIVFAAVVLIMIFLAKFLEGILKIGSLNAFNKIAGAFFGIIKTGLIISIVLALLRPINNHLEIISTTTKAESKLYFPVIRLSQYLFPALDEMKKVYREKVN